MTQSTRAGNDMEKGTSGHDGKRRVRRWIAGAALVALGATGGAFTTIAVDAGAHGGWHHGFRIHDRSYSSSPERAIERVQRMSAWALGRVDATDAQRERIDAILAAAVNDLFPLRDEHLAHHRALIAELARPQVDPAALERVRASELALVEKATDRLLDTTVAIAGVLDAEQRQRLVERFAEHGR